MFIFYKDSHLFSVNSLSTIKYINAPKKGTKIININHKIFNNIFTPLLKNSIKTLKLIQCIKKVLNKLCY